MRDAGWGFRQSKRDARERRTRGVRREATPPTTNRAMTLLTSLGTSARKVIVSPLNTSAITNWIGSDIQVMLTKTSTNTAQNNTQYVERFQHVMAAWRVSGTVPW